MPGGGGLGNPSPAGDDTLNGGSGGDTLLDDTNSAGEVDIDELVGGSGDDQLNARDQDAADFLDGGTQVQFGDFCQADVGLPGVGEDVVVNCEL